MLRTLSFRILPALLALLSLTAVAAPTRSQSGKRSTAAAPAPVSDAQIDATLKTKLAKSKIGQDGLKYKVSHGVVTWEGKTDVMQHKGAATRMAHSAGATQVVNNIQISAAAKQKAAANLQRNSGAAPKHATVL